MKPLLIGAAVCIASGIVHEVHADVETVWHTDYEAAKAIAGQNGLPMFVVFR